MSKGGKGGEGKLGIPVGFFCDTQLSGPSTTLRGVDGSEWGMHSSRSALRAEAL